MIIDRNAIDIEAADWSLRDMASRGIASVRRIGKSARSSYARMMIRGQLGPSVGYPSDRRPEPPF